MSTIKPVSTIKPTSTTKMTTKAIRTTPKVSSIQENFQVLQLLVSLPQCLSLTSKAAPVDSEAAHAYAPSQWHPERTTVPHLSQPEHVSVLSAVVHFELRCSTMSMKTPHH